MYQIICIDAIETLYIMMFIDVILCSSITSLQTKITQTRLVILKSKKEHHLAFFQNVYITTYTHLNPLLFRENNICMKVFQFWESYIVISILIKIQAILMQF